MELKGISRLSQWIKLYKLYISAFPRYERKPFFMIVRMHKKGRADVWVIENEGEFSGLAITMSSGNLVLLDYFAVCPESRKKGIGSQALKRLQAIYSDCRFFLEIESTLCDSYNSTERFRRKEFYLNNGMSPLDISVDLFGTEMELLGYNCTLAFEEYLSVYVDNFGEWAKSKITEINHSI